LRETLVALQCVDMQAKDGLRVIAESDCCQATCRTRISTFLSRAGSRSRPSGAIGVARRPRQVRLVRESRSLGGWSVLKQFAPLSRVSVIVAIISGQQLLSRRAPYLPWA
jgi:hypothetical protein